MKTKVLIILEIEHAQKTDPFAVVDAALDAGYVQDAINRHTVEGEGKCKVTSALSWSEHQYLKGSL